MQATRSLADAVIVLHSTDDYQVAVSAAAVSMDEKGERFLLALDRDGKPLLAGQGPVKLIVPGDPAMCVDSRDRRDRTGEAPQDQAQTEALRPFLLRLRRPFDCGDVVGIRQGRAQITGSTS